MLYTTLFELILFRIIIVLQLQLFVKFFFETRWISTILLTTISWQKTSKNKRDDTYGENADVTRTIFHQRFGKPASGDAHASFMPYNRPMSVHLCDFSHFYFRWCGDLFGECEDISAWMNIICVRSHRSTVLLKWTMSWMQLTRNSLLEKIIPVPVRTNIVLNDTHRTETKSIETIQHIRPYSQLVFRIT